jgi:hypothetical protein
VMQFENGGATQFSTFALVGLGGVGEAVADHDAALRECRLNYFGDVLRALGEHQGHFSHGGKARGGGIQQNLADFFAG